jgi:N-acetylglucosamine-6-phosphate deacetylase
MAGSALSMNRAVAVFQRYAGISLSDALAAATVNPGRLLDRSVICTELAPGQVANLVTFGVESESLRVERVLLGGEQVYPTA